jgi:general secretion pathway protein A
MYAPYFGLRQEPFSIAPDPRYLFMSERHREALAHLVYGLSSGGGFVLLTGEIGTGKTTVCRAFLEQVPAHCRVAYIFNPRLTVPELLQTICQEFQVPPGPARAAGEGVKGYIDALNSFLLQEHAAGRQCVLIIDEAQNLAPDVLEQLRLLTNLETSERKLLQIILIGQPELRAMLATPQLEQLAQRVIARYHLLPLTEQETAQYVRHRLEVAGLDRVPPFEASAVRRIHRLARGNPRRINLLCDRALLGAFARSRAGVSAALVDQAAGEVFDDGVRAPRVRRRVAVLGAVGVLGAMGVAAAGMGLVGAVSAGWAIPGTAWMAASLRPDKEVLARDPAQAASTSGDARVQPAADLPPRLLASQEAAWRELALGWGAQVPSAGAACPQLARDGLQCFRGTLSLPLIRELDRPGIVTLDPDGTPSFAVLVKLAGDRATLRAQGTEQTVTLEALGRRWKGDWATLWRAPEGYTGRSVDAWRSPLVDWATAQLPAASGDSPGPDVQGGLRDRLRSFQVAQGLAPTGTFTPMTYMQLNRVARVDEPRLRERP